MDSRSTQTTIAISSAEIDAYFPLDLLTSGLSPMEVAQKLRDGHAATGWTLTQISERYGKDPAWATRTNQIAKLHPELHQYLNSKGKKRLTNTAALVISALPPPKQLVVAELVMEHCLSAQATRRLCQGDTLEDVLRRKKNRQAQNRTMMRLIACARDIERLQATPLNELQSYVQSQPPARKKKILQSLDTLSAEIAFLAKSIRNMR